MDANPSKFNRCEREVVMKKQMLSSILILLVFCPQIAFSQAQDYYNSDGWFSFKVPADWEEIGNMDEVSDKISAMANRRINYNAGFKKIDNSIPYMYVQIKKTGKLSESDIQSILGKSVQNKAFVNANKAIDESNIKNKLSIIANQDPVYFPARHMAVWTSKIKFGDRDRFQVTCLLFSNYGYVALYFYAAEQNFDDNLNRFLNLAESFQFDNQFKY